MNWIWISLTLVLVSSSLHAQRFGFDYTTDVEDVHEAGNYTLSKSHPTSWDKLFKSKRINENDNHRVTSTKPSPRILRVNHERIKSRKFLKISTNSSGVTVETIKTKSHQKMLREVDYEDAEKLIVRNTDKSPTVESPMKMDTGIHQQQMGFSSTFKEVNGTRTFCPKDVNRNRRGSKIMRLDVICFIMERKLKLSSQIFSGGNGSLFASLGWELYTEMRQTDESSVYHSKHVEIISERRTSDGHNISSVEKTNEKSIYYPKVIQIASFHSKKPRNIKVNLNGNSGKWQLISGNQQFKSLSCLNEHLNHIERECHNDAASWYQSWTTENLKDCLAEFNDLTISIEILRETVSILLVENCQLQSKFLILLFSGVWKNTAELFRRSRFRRWVKTANQIKLMFVKSN